MSRNEKYKVLLPPAGGKRYIMLFFQNDRVLTKSCPNCLVSMKLLEVSY